MLSAANMETMRNSHFLTAEFYTARITVWVEIIHRNGW